MKGHVLICFYLTEHINMLSFMDGVRKPTLGLKNWKRQFKSSSGSIAQSHQKTTFCSSFKMLKNPRCDV